MADSSSESHFHSDAFGLRRISSSFPSIPNLFVGFNTKGSLDSDSVRSPTSPLDFRLFSNLSNSFKLKSLRSNGPPKKWDCSEVGLGIVNSIADEVKCSDEIPILKHKHIIFGRKVKNFGNLDQSYPLKSNSLPRNYTILPERKVRLPASASCGGHVSLQNGEFPSKPELLRSHSLDTGRSRASVENPSINCSRAENVAARTISEKPLEVHESSLPIPVGRCTEITSTLSVGEIESSEDYTCIISYGPNSKTTHIFGDRVLEYFTTSSSSILKKEDLGAGMNEVGEPNEKADSHYPKPLMICYSCKGELNESEELYTDGFEKAFCSRKCHSTAEQVDEDSSEDLLELNDNEDLFIMGT